MRETYREDPKNYGPDEHGEEEPARPCGRVESDVAVGHHDTNHGHRSREFRLSDVEAVRP